LTVKPVKTSDIYANSTKNVYFYQRVSLVIQNSRNFVVITSHKTVIPL